MPFKFTPLRIADVVLIEARSFADDRGLFRELWQQRDFAAAGLDLNFVQDNHSRSVRNVLRGLHYQKPPRAQGKLVFTLSGEIYDVAVDVRRSSPTFGQWVSATLTGDNGHALWVPPGFAHGFIVRSETAHVVYKVTDVYAPDCDRGVVWNDPALDIDWGVAEPLLSPKDAVLPCLNDTGPDFA
jgi:dTDP-4-dehydrorhamnose 3,5-epimerase